jgi:hypothetical protein
MPKSDPRKKRASKPNAVTFTQEGAAILELAGGHRAIVDIVDYAAISCYRWHRSGKAPLYYASTNSVIGDSVKHGTSLHSFLAGDGGRMEVDHRDGDGLNCRRVNLRTATRSQNNANQRKQAGRSSRIQGRDVGCSSRPLEGNGRLRWQSR